jgi:hypothetical protein
MDCASQLDNQQTGSRHIQVTTFQRKDRGFALRMNTNLCEFPIVSLSCDGSQSVQRGAVRLLTSNYVIVGERGLRYGCAIPRKTIEDVSDKDTLGGTLHVPSTWNQSKSEIGDVATEYACYFYRVCQSKLDASEYSSAWRCFSETEVRKQCLKSGKPLLDCSL